MLKAFVISLAGADVRRRKICSLLDGHIGYEIIDATSGSEVAERERDFCTGRYCPRAFRDLTFNEIACSVSHTRAIERFLQSGTSHG
jgi:GR25 family glycosyltransferase involved in LPS biosynthesis